MISGFSNQQSERFSNLGQSLAQLGQQVGQQLAMREYQKQATAALPAMQANYRQAFSEIEQGRFADGYMKMLETNMQFGTDQNPFLASAAQQANEMFALAGKQEQSEAWRRLQAGGGGGGGIPAAQEPSINFGQLFPGMKIPIGSDTGMDSEFVGDDFTQGTPDQREAQRAADREFRTYEDADRAAAEGLPRQQDITLDMIRDLMPADKRKELDALSDFQKDAVVASVNNDRLPPAQKQAATNQSGVTQDAMPKTSELWKDPRLEKYFPGAVGIAKPSEKKELRGTGISFTSRGRLSVSSAPQVTNQEVLDVWGKNKEKLEQALDAMDDANMRKLFDEYKDIFSLRAAAQPEGDEFLVGTEQITEKQYNALLTLSNLPVWTQEEFTPVVFKEAAAAPAAGGDDIQAQSDAIFGLTTQTMDGTTPDTAQPSPDPAPRPIEFSQDNPYSRGLPAMSQDTTRPRGSVGRGSGTRERQVAARKLNEVNDQIKNLDSYRAVGRRPSTKEEKAIRWEELNAEKKRLEQILASK